MITWVSTCVAAAVLLSAPPPASPTPVADQSAEVRASVREIQVRIVLQMPAGDPPPSLPFRLFGPGDVDASSSIAVGRTDEQGIVTLRGLAPMDAKRVFVGPNLPRENVDANTARESAIATRDLDALRMKYYVPDLAYRGPRPYVDPIAAAQGPVDVHITAFRAVVASGIIEAHDGTPPVDRPSIFARASSSPVRADRNGLFRVFGIPKDAANELFVTGFPHVVPVPVAAARTEADFSLPPIQLPNHSDTFELRVKVDGWAALRSRLMAEDGGRMFSDGMTLIRSDGNVILTWLGDANQKSDAPRRAPAGKYYLAPGRFSAHPLQLRLLDAVRAGVDLSKTEVPSIELPQPGADVLVLDSVQAAAAIEKVTLPVGDAGGGRAPQGP